MTLDKNAITIVLGEMAPSAGLGPAHAVYGGQEVTIRRTTTMATSTTREVVREVVGTVVYSMAVFFFAASREKNKRSLLS